MKKLITAALLVSGGLAAAVPAHARCPGEFGYVAGFHTCTAPAVSSSYQASPVFRPAKGQFGYIGGGTSSLAVPTYPYSGTFSGTYTLSPTYTAPYVPTSNMYTDSYYSRVLGRNYITPQQMYSRYTVPYYSQPYGQPYYW